MCSSPVDKKALAQVLADHLLGTCKILEVAFDDCGIAEELQNDTDFLVELDDRVSECSQCGWWVETHDTEVVGGHTIICNECSAGDEEE